MTVLKYWDGAAWQVLDAQGPAGPGVPPGGAAGQALTKVTATDFDTAWQTLVTSVGLSTNVPWLAVGGSPITAAGTITVNVGSSGTPNLFWAAPSSGSGLWLARAIAPADLPLFVAAGGSHAAGAVPDPGATAHTYVPYLLGDGAAWLPPVGKLLGTSFVAADESTGSAGPAGLTTGDVISPNLDANVNFLLLWTANVYNSTTNNTNCRDTVIVDGVIVANFDTGTPTAGVGVAAVFLYKGTTTGSSNPRRIEVAHGVTAGGTGHWRSRGMALWLLP